jgi:hypothetical protein
MLLACDRDQLIERRLIERQLAYLAIPLRQKILGIPSKLGNHFGDGRVPVRKSSRLLPDAGARGLDRSFEFASNSVRSRLAGKDGRRGLRKAIQFHSSFPTLLLGP